MSKSAIHCLLLASRTGTDRIRGSAIIASIGSAEIADRIGRRLTLLIALIISFVAVGVEFAATSNPIFFVGKLLNGFMVGTVGTVMITYIGEVLCRKFLPYH